MRIVSRISEDLLISVIGNFYCLGLQTDPLLTRLITGLRASFLGRIASRGSLAVPVAEPAPGGRHPSWTAGAHGHAYHGRAQGPPIFPSPPNPSRVKVQFAFALKGRGFSRADTCREL